MRNARLFHTLPLAALAGVILLILSGCAPALPDAAPRLIFRAPMNVSADQEFHVTLGVHNAGTARFPGDDAFDGVMEIRGPGGAPRARMELVELGPVEPGESAFPTAWRGGLEPGAYRLIWGAPGYGHTAVEFSVVERDGRRYLGDEMVVAQYEGDPPVGSE